MINYDEAFALVCAAASPMDGETVSLAAAHGRHLIADVTARINAPRTDVSSMDGYAVAGGADGYHIVGSSYPGFAFAGSLANGECVKIFTGATVPAGTERVVIQEVVERDGDQMRIVAPVGMTSYIRARGADFHIGQTVLRSGDKLTARALIVAAGADIDTLTVGRKPRIAIVATGDELVPPGQSLALAGSIPESVSCGLNALLSDYGGLCLPVVLAPDDLEATIRIVQETLDSADLVVIVGGASVGEKDFARAAFIELGFDPAFTKVAMKPGKPVWFGHVRGKPVMGLPGNPTSAYVTARLLLTPLVVGLAGGRPADAVRWALGTLGADLPACAERETFTRGDWQANAVVGLPYQDSGAQLTLASASLLIRQRAGAPALFCGEQVSVVEL